MDDPENMLIKLEGLDFSGKSIPEIAKNESDLLLVVDGATAIQNVEGEVLRSVERKLALS